ncbi:hypothetical protein LX32DRAFT_252474 [Colletotrichum zoysiae]|uniref:Uncharacterized protein n=1 Tax=Colletotrichum zoysiae TaxID=1216348 RepID=A0AAD9MA97_9PEZI|nr:hypothetical protein LX32DRAFT_252474 [Colletotrichum zoysiae]
MIAGMKQDRTRSYLSSSQEPVSAGLGHLLGLLGESMEVYQRVLMAIGLRKYGRWVLWMDFGRWVLTSL